MADGGSFSVGGLSGVVIAERALLVGLLLVVLLFGGLLSDFARYYY